MTPREKILRGWIENTETEIDNTNTTHADYYYLIKSLRKEIPAILTQADEIKDEESLGGRHPVNGGSLRVSEPHNSATADAGRRPNDSKDGPSEEDIGRIKLIDIFTERRFFTPEECNDFYRLFEPGKETVTATEIMNLMDKWKYDKLKQYMRIE